MDIVSLSVIGIALAIQVINAITVHWSEKEGLVKVLLFVSEVLSIISSSGVLPKVKPLLSSRRPD